MVELDPDRAKPTTNKVGRSVRPISGSGLTVTRRGRPLLNNVDVEFADHRLTAIIGPNGAGKSLLLKLLCGVTPPDRGTVRWAGRRPSKPGYRKLALVLQTPVLLRRTVLANISYALRVAGTAASDVRDLATAALERAGLDHLANQSARLLSGGEKQRLALARSLAIGPEVLLLDEPVSSLDPSSTLAIETMIADARLRGVTIVLVTHDLAQARRLADDVIFMHHGQIVEQGNADRFFEKPETDLAKLFLAGEIIT